MDKPPARQRLLLGMPVGVQAVAVMVTTLLICGLVTFAVYAWLERTA